MQSVKCPCPDCGCDVLADWHDACHEMWEVGQQNASERDRSHTAKPVLSRQTIREMKALLEWIEDNP